MQFPGSSCHIVAGALVPVEIDVAANRGVYVEPNLWIQHDIDLPGPMRGPGA